MQVGRRIHLALSHETARSLKSLEEHPEVNSGQAFRVLPKERLFLFRIF